MTKELLEIEILSIGEQLKSFIQTQHISIQDDLQIFLSNLRQSVNRFLNDYERASSSSNIGFSNSSQSNLKEDISTYTIDQLKVGILEQKVQRLSSELKKNRARDDYIITLESKAKELSIEKKKLEDIILQQEQKLDQALNIQKYVEQKNSSFNNELKIALKNNRLLKRSIDGDKKKVEGVTNILSQKYEIEIEKLMKALSDKENEIKYLKGLNNSITTEKSSNFIVIKLDLETNLNNLKMIYHTTCTENHQLKRVFNEKLNKVKQSSLPPKYEKNVVETEESTIAKGHPKRNIKSGKKVLAALNRSKHLNNISNDNNAEDENIKELSIMMKNVLNF